jgi:acyl-coenzyme A synthetase/AMP-(fatty) acid ligase
MPGALGLTAVLANEFLDALPMTTTGKVQRRLLRERSLRPA